MEDHVATAGQIVSEIEALLQDLKRALGEDGGSPAEPGSMDEARTTGSAPFPGMFDNSQR